jgi:GGDEF domain-containing protein
MLSPPFLEHEVRHAEVFSDNYLSPVPRDERFDRITRTAMRLLQIPVAFIAEADESQQWLRSVQGLPSRETGRALDFCGRTVLKDQVLMVADTSIDMQFWENPLVTGAAHVRSFIGIPLRGAGGTSGGTLCAMHTQAHAFRQSDVLALTDLGRMAEAELRIERMATAQKRLAARVSQLERRAEFDSVTGCWNVPRFRELLATSVADAVAKGETLGLCYVRVRNFADLESSAQKRRMGAIRQVVAQELRQRLPDHGALATLGGSDFCALVPGPTAQAVEDRLAAFKVPRVTLDGPGMRFDLELELGFGLAFLHETRPASGATELWATALARIEP